jgi:hypothetical protein
LYKQQEEAFGDENTMRDPIKADLHASMTETKSE